MLTDVINHTLIVELGNGDHKTTVAEILTILFTTYLDVEFYTAPSFI